MAPISHCGSVCVLHYLARRHAIQLPELCCVVPCRLRFGIQGICLEFIRRSAAWLVTSEFKREEWVSGKWQHLGDYSLGTGVGGRLLEEQRVD